jgi:hypothetical protein
VNRHLETRGIRIATGTIVDATIIHAPSSTKNEAGERDPAMHQTKKGKQWYFGLKGAHRQTQQNSPAFIVPGSSAPCAELPLANMPIPANYLHAPEYIAQGERIVLMKDLDLLDRRRLQDREATDIGVVRIGDAHRPRSNNSYRSAFLDKGLEIFTV